MRTYNGCTSGLPLAASLSTPLIASIYPSREFHYTGLNRRAGAFTCYPNFREESMSLVAVFRSLGAIALGLALLAPLAWAQDAPPVRVRGTIERVDGNTLF